MTEAGPTVADQQTAARLRRQYEATGYCVSAPLVDLGALDDARGAAAAVMAAGYDTGVPPIYRNWNPGDPPRSLVKIDLPHRCNKALQQLVADPRIGAWAAGVLNAEFVQLWASELIYKFPETSGEPQCQGAIGWHQDDRFWAHWAGEVFTLWLALVDVDERMGPIRYVAGSHRWGTQGKARFFFETDLDGQRDLIGAPPGHSWREVAATVSAGAVSMHHRRTLHCSQANHSDLPRVGLALHLRTERARLVPTHDPPFHTPDLLDPNECPVMFGVARVDVAM